MTKIILLILCLGILASSGMAAVSPDDLIAHWKMNENTASDNDELVTGGTFTSWTNDTPDGWTVTGEVGAGAYGTRDPEVSQVATGQSHANAGGETGGMCNLYTSDGTSIYLSQTLATVVGRKYRVSINVNKVTDGAIVVEENRNTDWAEKIFNSTGTHTWTFVATATNPIILIKREVGAAADVTFDDVSIKLCAAEDSSGNDHDGLLQEHTADAHVAGKINGAFDFDGSADYIEIADSDDFTFALTPFSFSMWVLIHEATDFPIASKGVEGTDGEWRLYTDGSDKLFARLYDENIDKYIGRTYDAAALAEDEWLHIVMTSDGTALSGGINLYVDGVNVDDTDDESATFVAVENLTGPVWIGYDGTNYADGLIDNVMIFSTDLDISEIEALYNHGAGTEIIAEIDERRGRRNR